MRVLGSIIVECSHDAYDLVNSAYCLGDPSPVLSLHACSLGPSTRPRGLAPRISRVVATIGRTLAGRQPLSLWQSLRLRLPLLRDFPGSGLRAHSGRRFPNRRAREGIRLFPGSRICRGLGARARPRHLHLGQRRADHVTEPRRGPTALLEGQALAPRNPELRFAGPDHQFDRLPRPRDQSSSRRRLPRRGPRRLGQARCGERGPLPAHVRVRCRSGADRGWPAFLRAPIIGRHPNHALRGRWGRSFRSRYRGLRRPAIPPRRGGARIDEAHLYTFSRPSPGGRCVALADEALLRAAAFVREATGLRVRVFGFDAELRTSPMEPLCSSDREVVGPHHAEGKGR